MTKAKLMIPGPVDIAYDVRQAMAIHSMPHYGDDWISLLGETQEMSKRVFQTENDLLIVAGPGTMALEAAIRSPFEPGDKIIVAINGFFGERIMTLVESNALIPVLVKAPMGQPIALEAISAAFEANPDVKAIAVVHHETSTGVLNPLQEIAQVAKAHNALVIVDAVSSMGGVPLPVDVWGIDLCVSVANKALETPPALALVSVSSQAWDAIHARQSTCGWYLDLKTWHWYAKNWGDWHPTPVTMPTSNLYALHRSLQLFLADGLERRYQAYRAASHAVREGLKALGFAMLVHDAYASPLTTAFCVPTNLDADDLQHWLSASAGVMISGGIGDLRGQILRVGHIGLARKRDYVVAFLLAVEDYLRSLGEPVVRGQSLVAIDGLEF